MFFYKNNKEKIKNLINKICNEQLWHIVGITLSVLLMFSLGTGIFAQIVRSSDSLSAKIDLGENWYGEEYQFSPAAADNGGVWGNVVLELMDYSTLPKALVLINGEQKASFREQQVTVRVENGDVITVDTTAYGSAVRVRIKSVSSVIDTKNLREITVVDGCRDLGKVSFR